MGNLSSAERIVLDIDGVIFHGDKLIDGAREAICRIMSKFTNTYFLSNSSLTTSNQLCRKLNKHGIDIDVEYVLTSASAVIQFCLRKKIKNIYLIAEKAIHKEFKKNKINTDCVGKSSEAVVVLLNRDFEYKHIIDSEVCKGCGLCVDRLRSAQWYGGRLHRLRRSERVGQSGRGRGVRRGGQRLRRRDRRRRDRDLVHRRRR